VDVTHMLALNMFRANKWQINLLGNDLESQKMNILRFLMLLPIL